MQKGRVPWTGPTAVAIVVCLILLVSVPGGAQVLVPDTTVPLAITTVITETTNVTSQPTLPVEENRTAEPPPLLILGTPEIDNLTVTMHGTAAPGSVNVNIEDVLWDWGDATAPEYHSFPHSHRYASPGSYTLSISAIQSDGQNFTRSTNVSLGEPPVLPTLPPAPVTSVPGAPGFPAGAPVLTLLEPVIDGLNVTLNGNLNPDPWRSLSPRSASTGTMEIFRPCPIFPATHRIPLLGLHHQYHRLPAGRSIDHEKILVDLKEEPGARGRSRQSVHPTTLRSISSSS
jgi:hypothetical protein